MHALVVYESMFGNTMVIADAIGAGLSEYGTVEVVEVGNAPASPHPDLLVVGAPTHALSLSKESTRRNAAEMTTTGLVSNGTGAREWLDSMPRSDGMAAAFCTRVKGPLGSGARAIARRLRTGGRELIAPPADFYVRMKAAQIGSALQDREPDRARAWGSDLGRIASSRSQAHA